MAISVLLKVMPEGTDTDVDRIKETVEERVKIEDIRVEEVAFGLKAVKVLTLVDDEEGAADEVEDELSDIEGVRTVEVEEVNKL